MLSIRNQQSVGQTDVKRVGTFIASTHGCRVCIYFCNNFNRSLLFAASSLCDREEWAWLQSHAHSTASAGVQNLLGAEDESLVEGVGLVDFVRCLRAAVTHLLTKLNIPLYRVTLVANSHLQPLLSE